MSARNSNNSNIRPNWAAAALTLGLAAAICCSCTCSDKGNKGSSTPAAATNPSGPKVVNLFIWTAATTPELLAAFEATTGIRVQESNYSSNEELLGKLQAGASGYDVIVPSDYMVAAMANLGLLTPLDRTKVPNFAGVEPRWLGKPFDPENKFSIPYGWSLTGIAVNTAQVATPVKGWADLFGATSPAAGRVSLLDDSRETIAAALKFKGHSVNSKNPAELEEAKATLIAAKKNIKSFTSTPTGLLESGDIAIAHMYSNEAHMAQHKPGSKIAFVLPEEGGTLAIDNYAIPKDAPHLEAAHSLINFLLDPARHADLVKRIYVGPVVKGTLDRLPTDLKADETLFPTEAALSRWEMMQDLGDATSQYDRVWTEVKAAGT